MRLLVLTLILSSLLVAQVQSLDNGLALTPPMGWISWERFTCETNCKENPGNCIDQDLYLDMATRLDEDGYRELGYNRINIDDCWSEKQRDKQQRLAADRARFPMGIEGLARLIHSKLLKIGIYGDCGTATCDNYPAQLKSQDNFDDNYFSTDAQTFAEWEIDSFKFDGCNIDPDKAESICPRMATALNQTNRKILLSCEWPFYSLRRSKKAPNFQLAKDSCNLWRYYEDVYDSWESVLNIVDFSIKLQNDIVKFHGPGGWFDPDQLVIGNFGLSLEQAKAQMAIWSIWSAPLYMSNDLRDIEPEMSAILKNKKAIAIDQDKLGIFGLMVAETGDRSIQAFIKPVAPIVNGCPSFAILYLNRRTLGNVVRVSFKLRDLVTKAPIGLASMRASRMVTRNFDANDCKRRLTTAMTREPSPVQLVDGPITRRPKVEESSVTYNVEDIFENMEPAKVDLNSTLELDVKLTGVRMVKLVEIS